MHAFRNFYGLFSTLYLLYLSESKLKAVTFSTELNMQPYTLQSG